MLHFVFLPARGIGAKCQDSLALGSQGALEAEHQPSVLPRSGIAGGRNRWGGSAGGGSGLQSTRGRGAPGR
jgi:hypothetical protein